MEKKGLLVYQAIIALIAASLILIGYVQAGKSFGNQEAFYKLAVAEDIALTIDLIYGLPGDITYVYPNDVSGYDVEIRENTIKIYKTESRNSDRTLQSYVFAGSGREAIEFTIKNQKFVKIDKINGKIKVTGVSERFAGKG